ncbi:zinc finger and BTB domain-containing protein 47 [Caerostris darwini]|uniref:Zinc finger and BTB domain-containing protein 47 n=1 Tax=Caerostris darwini TaxID=1538125 RepID=A0AAV4VCK6_9ARAC|nr:zinc finger and BTB domain-containing protein 47 [Caerostris darwini]
MSTFRVVSRIIPTCAQAQNICNLMVAQDIDTPARTEWSCTGDRKTGNYVVTQTTFCKEKFHPPNTDLDKVLADECEAIPGLVNLKKSKLHLTKECKDAKNEESQPEPIIKVTPYVLKDGSCGGILVSVPLRLTKSDLQGKPNASNLYFTSSNLEEPLSEEKSDKKSEAAKVRKPKPATTRKKEPKKKSKSKSQKTPKQKIWKCCGKEFTDALLYCYHQESHASNYFECDVCFKEFSGKRALKNHKKTH